MFMYDKKLRWRCSLRPTCSSVTGLISLKIQNLEVSIQKTFLMGSLFRRQKPRKRNRNLKHKGSRFFDHSKKTSIMKASDLNFFIKWSSIKKIKDTHDPTKMSFLLNTYVLCSGAFFVVYKSRKNSRNVTEACYLFI